MHTEQMRTERGTSKVMVSPRGLGTPLIVHTSSGAVRGTTSLGVDHGLRVRTWRGVPFGESTAGEYRFCAPRPVGAWSGVRDCTAYGQIAPQPTLGPRSKVKGSEDCLNLDIVRPDNEDTLPVVVYLHGGSFFLGASHEQLLRGHYLSHAMNVVYVSINFRLGVLGYLDMSSFGDACVANPAVLDQLLALRWVQENIAAFGGDPNNVTLMGESAGGAAALTLMCVPQSRGLFHRVIAQSPPIATVHSQAQARFWTQQLRRRLGFSEDATLQDLRALPMQDLVNAGHTMLWRSRELLFMNACYGPTIDGELLTDHPLHIFARGEQHPVPLLLGTNLDEASFAKGMYLRSNARANAAQRMLHAFDPEGAPNVLKEYGEASTRREFAQLLADAVFWAPALNVAQSHQAVAPTWMYRFDFAPAVWRWLGLGAMHTMELTPVFGDLQGSRAARINNVASRAALEQLKSAMQEYWASFMHGGSPGGVWPRYRVRNESDGGVYSRATMVFNQDVQLRYNPQPHRREAWQQYTMTQWGLGRPELLEQLEQRGVGDAVT